MITLRDGDRYLELAPCGGVSERGTRVSVRDALEGARLLRPFATAPSGTRAMRRALALGPTGRGAAHLDDADVLERLGKELARGSFVAFRWRDPLRPGPVIELEAEPLKVTERALTWVGIQLVDTEGEPAPGERYVLHLPDGSSLEGRLDAKGFARVEKIPGGNCKVTFPDLDRSDWRRA